MEGKTGYFQALEGFYWQWEDDNVAAIPNGNTIAYKPPLGEIMTALAPQGLPPLGSLLLAIIATNPTAVQSLEQVRSKLNAITNDGQYAVYSDLCDEVLQFLELLTRVPEEFKRDQGRIRLFQTIFENNHHRLSVSDSRYHCLIVSDPNRDIPLGFRLKKPFQGLHLRKDLRTLSLIGRKYSSVNDILKAIADLPEITELEEFPDTPVADPDGNYETDFVSELINTPETFHTGALIRHLWGGLNIPIHSSMPSNQPLGGFADLTNKGDFDKLLVSEFANDDLVFMSRLANNEALYIQREIPPHHNELERIILIDSSLKNWGTPKTVAFAVALAIGKHPKTDIACRTYVIGESYAEVNTNSIAALVEGLHQLEVNLNSAKGLRAFLGDLTTTSKHEIFVVTERSTLKQAAMLQAANECHSDIDYWIYTDAVGNIDVHKKQQAGKRHLQHLLLPLDELWTKAPRELQKRPVNDDKYRGIYPILFRTPPNFQLLPVPEADECYLLTTQNKLFRYYGKISERATRQTGWQLLREKLPITGVCEIGSVDGRIILMTFNNDSNKGYLLEMGNGREQTFELPTPDSNRGRVVFENGTFYYVSWKGAWSINALSGEVVSVNPGKAKIDTLADKKLEFLKQFSSFSAEKSVLRNIHSVSISKEGNIVLNNAHRLSLTSGKIIQISNNTGAIGFCKSHLVSDQLFRFDDGSTIEVNRSGALVLTSSNANIPVMFVPTVLNSALGIATEEVFAGNAFFKTNQERVCETTEFFQEFVYPFISTITDHGTNA